MVVPAHNERDRLPGCLDSLEIAADRASVPVTVVVVLDACTDGSQDVLNGSVRVVRIAARNVGSARAAGFASLPRVSGQDSWYATTDADSRVSPTWLSDQVDHHGNGAHAMVGTVAVDWRHHGAETQRAYERLYARPGAPRHGHVHGANLGVRSDAYWRVGGFRPLRTGEDVDLVRWLTNAGARITWDAHNPVVTSDRPDPRADAGFGDFVNGLRRNGFDYAERDANECSGGGLPARIRRSARS